VFQRVFANSSSDFEFNKPNFLSARKYTAGYSPMMVASIAMMIFDIFCIISGDFHGGEKRD
jgi:hypothetical protein